MQIVNNSTHRIEIGINVKGQLSLSQFSTMSYLYNLTD